MIDPMVALLTLIAGLLVGLAVQRFQNRKAIRRQMEDQQLLLAVLRARMQQLETCERETAQLLRQSTSGTESQYRAFTSEVPTLQHRAGSGSLPEEAALDSALAAFSPDEIKHVLPCSSSTT